MAPHDTNTKREARRHWFPLAGMAILVAIVLVGFLWWVARAGGLLGDAEPVPEGGLQQEDAIETNEPVATPTPATPPQ
jgi:hypothetical protein